MKRTSIILAMIFGLSIMMLPSFAGTASAQGRGSVYRYRQIGNWQGQGRHMGWRNKKYTYGYRNYGQYRRTQVGNRRSGFWTMRRYGYRSRYYPSYRTRYSRRYLQTMTDNGRYYRGRRHRDD